MTIVLRISITTVLVLAPLGAFAQDAVQQEQVVPAAPQGSTAPAQQPQQVVVVEQGSAGQQEYAPMADDAQPEVETRVRIGLVIGGAVMFGVSYVFHAALISPLAGIHIDSPDDGQWNDFRAYGAIPLVGPWLQLAAKPTDPTNDGWATYLAVNGILQSAGVTMLILGFVLRKPVGGYADSGPSIRVTPMIGEQVTGLTASGRF